MIVKVCKGCGKTFVSNRHSRIYCNQVCANQVVSQQREDQKVSGKAVTVWSCGGGVQSSAIAALIVRGKLPKPDYALMVDVGWEKATTWDNVCGTLQPALQAVGVDLQILRTTDYRDNDLFDRQGHLVLPGYRRLPDGSIQRLNTHCSGAWKLKVVQRWLRNQGVQHARNWVGISTDEIQRARPSTLKWFELSYPLITLRLDRMACHRLLWDMGWNDVRHSSCYLCPQQNSEQWLYMYAGKDGDWQRAVAIDESIRQRDPDLYLHRLCMPLTEWARQQRDSGYLALMEPCGDPGACSDCL